MCGSGTVCFKQRSASTRQQSHKTGGTAANMAAPVDRPRPNGQSGRMDQSLAVRCLRSRRSGQSRRGSQHVPLGEENYGRQVDDCGR